MSTCLRCGFNALHFLEGLRKLISREIMSYQGTERSKRQLKVTHHDYPMMTIFGFSLRCQIKCDTNTVRKALLCDLLKRQCINSQLSILNG